MFFTFPTFPQRPNQQEEAESNPPPRPRPRGGAVPTQERSWKSSPNTNWIKFTYKLTNKIDQRQKLDSSVVTIWNRQLLYGVSLKFVQC